MKRAIYIHGLGGSGTGSSATNVRIFLEGKYTLDAHTYDLLQPEEAYTQIKKDTENYDLIIASSLGGFYASTLKVPGNIILLNPCLEPKTAIPPLLYPEQKEGFNQEKCFYEWDKISENWKTRKEPFNTDGASLETGKIAGVFADKDEYFSFKEKFLSLFGCETGQNCINIQGTHEIAKHPEMLKAALEKALDYIEKN